jgi:glycosyltransferase involved in cell wall biosynthesis
MTKVVHIQHYTETTGRAALRLHKAFLNAGLDSSIVALTPAINDDERVKHTGKWTKLIAWLDNKIQPYLKRHLVKEFGSFSNPLLGSNLSRIEEVKKADYIYIHWALGGFLNLKSFEQIAKLGKPVIFFMHDMWNITGGCHHSFGCENYKTECNSCHNFSSPKKYDRSYKQFKKKLRLYSKYDNLYFVAPSEWLYGCAKQSCLTKNKLNFYIPNILDKSLFKPFDKKIAKAIFNIDADETVIAFGAEAVNSPYKGWSYLQQAIEILNKEQSVKKLSVLVFGGGDSKKIKDAIPVKTRFVGYLQDEYSMMLLYNATDVFIAPSLAESFGYVILESLCCGTPVVAFNTGGIPDLILHKKNGYLAKYKDAQDLATGIEFCLKNGIKGYMQPKFEPDIIVKKHFELFNYIQSTKQNISVKNQLDGIFEQ